MGLDMPDDLRKKSLTDILSDLQARAARPKENLSTKEAATHLGVSSAFLERDRWAGKRTGNGPLIPYVRIGNNAIRYRRTDLEAHISKNLHGASDEPNGGQADD
jgi:hypothetical protein